MRLILHHVLTIFAIRLALGLLLLSTALWGLAQSISYTVQVAALSSQSSAEGLRRTLTDAGYPAYLVSVPGDAQTVYRLRVGAFANRDAAQAYATAMRGIGGTVPAPALAEGIPPDLIPLEPDLIAAYPVAVGRLDIVPWSKGAALRVQPSAQNGPRIASYRVLAGAAAPFPAWRAAPLAGETSALERVTNLPLNNPERLGEVAEGLGLSAEQVQPYIFEGTGAKPHLVIAERFDPASGTGARYPALGNPASKGSSPAGPDLIWFGRAAPSGFPETLPDPLFSLSSSLQAGRVVVPEGEFAGDGWQAISDGRFTRISLGNRTWRALVGTPLWAGADFLLASVGSEVVLYKITRP